MREPADARRERDPLSFATPCRRARAAVAALVALLLAAPPAGAADEDLAAFAQRALRHAEVRGAGVAVLRAGRAPWIRAFGVRDARSGAPVTTATVFEAASLGKAVAAYGALVLVERGVFALDAPVHADRLEVDPGCDRPTLRQLLSHTAGLSNDLLAERWKGACRLPAPFAYAGQGWLVLQQMLEEHAGTSAEAFLQATVLAPLGMRRSTFAAPAEDDVAVGHVDALWGVGAARADGAVRAAAAAALLLAALAGWAVARRVRRRAAGARAWATLAVLWAAIALAVAAAGAAWIVPVRPWSGRVLLPSSLHTSADDLARFAAELLAPTLVRPETRDLLFRPEVEIGDGLAWGLGIGIDASTEPVTGWQWGSNPGFQGLLVVEPVGGEAVAVLTNTGGFADVLSRRRGGHNAAKRIARRALGIAGRWDLRPGTAP